MKGKGTGVASSARLQTTLAKLEFSGEAFTFHLSLLSKKRSTLRFPGKVSFAAAKNPAF